MSRGLIDLERLYSKHAERFDAVRLPSRMERPYLDHVIRVLAEGRSEARRNEGANATVLDLGCGTGEPMARYFVDRGCEVTGVDFAAGMLRIFRERFPEMPVRQADMRGLDLDREFDAVLAWDSFFHLSPSDQRGMFAVFQRHLRIGGALMFTSGPHPGEGVGGDLFGDELYHASLDTPEYRDQLASHGCEVVLHAVEDPDCGGHTIWIARRVR